jgi:hypothetical protein
MYQLMALLVMDNNLNAQAVRVVLRSIAHGLCHYHYLKEAIKPILAYLDYTNISCQPMRKIAMSAKIWLMYPIQIER